MIVAIEPTWTGTIHAPGNTTLLDIAKLAFPGETLAIHAEAGHVKEVKSLLKAAASPTVQFHTIELSDAFRHRPHIVSLRRLFREFQTIRKALSDVPPDEDCVLILLSVTSTSMVAANLLARLRPGRTFIQAQLHGNLNELTDWRHGDPVRRALDLKSVLSRRHRRMRYLVLEEFIRTRLAALSPATGDTTDVLPHPLALQGHVEAERPLDQPLRLGLVGLGSEEKGMSVFLRIAQQLKAELGDRIRFHHVGTFVPGTDPALYALLEEPPAEKQLTRQEFLARINRLHYVVFPFKQNYYGLSASGTFMDSVAALKPVIATRIPLTEQFFREFGPIGHLCDGEAEMVSTIRNIALKPDAETYRAQAETMRRGRAARSLEALAPGYRDIIRKALPGFAPAKDNQPL
jgi:glycosyltransferase involved in cell wall biosynthesis